MLIAFRKAAWGIIPANQDTEELVKRLNPGDLIEAKLIEGRRSDAQNRIYWLWLTEIGKASGHGKDELHEIVKRHYVMPVLVRDDEEYADILGKVQGLGKQAEETFIRRFISTTDLSVRQFTEVLNDIERDAAQRGIHLTHPDDLYWSALEKEADSTTRKQHG